MKAFKLIAIAPVCLLAAQSNAEIWGAFVGKGSDSIVVRDKLHNHAYTVWVQQPNGQYAASDRTFTTDGTGGFGGSAAGTNAFVKGAIVKLGSAQNPGSQAAYTVINGASALLSQPLTPGYNDFDVPFFQSSFGDGYTHLETWDSGTIWGMKLDPGQASFVNNGAYLQLGGDVQAQLLEVSSQRVLIQILGDQTSITNDDIRVRGMGIAVNQGVSSVGLEYGWKGSFTSMLDGIPTGTFSNSSLEFHYFGAIAAPTPGSGALLLLGMVSIAQRRRG